MRKTDHIVLLERQEDGSVTARQESQSLQQWSADQILSAYFGFPEGTYNDEVLKDEKDYQALLQEQQSGKLTDAQREQLAALKQKLDAAPKGDTTSEQELYAAADLVLDALEAQRERRRPSRIKENGE